jgi:NADH:ubiquinone oxidoreductase subunit 3 (subunit A)
MKKAIFTLSFIALAMVAGATTIAITEIQEADASKKDKKEICGEVEPSTFECGFDSKKECQEFTDIKCKKIPPQGGE